MFNSLEGTWDQSARRGRATFVSFTLQAFGVSILLAIPLLTIQGPPTFRWLQESPLLMPPSAPPAPSRGNAAANHPSNFRQGVLQEPVSIPDQIAVLHEEGVESAPDVSGIGVRGAIGTNPRGVLWGLGNNNPEVAPPPKPAAPAHPIQISHWSEGNLAFKVQPVYPALAKQARIQGTVELRAIISKTGTIENLAVLSGHPMLVKSALDAVRQWRYRPYLLNGEPVEVETDVTVNFVLSGG